MTASAGVTGIDEVEKEMDEELEDIDLDDDEFLYDESDGDDDDDSFELSGQYKSFSARRRIEIAREDKWLRSAMADFEDFDYLGEWQEKENWRSSY